MKRSTLCEVLVNRPCNGDDFLGASARTSSNKLPYLRFGEFHLTELVLFNNLTPAFSYILICQLSQDCLIRWQTLVKVVSPSILAEVS